MKISAKTFLGLAVLVSASPAFCAEALSITPGQTLSIDGNCAGTVQLSRNVYSGSLELNIQGERCSEVISNERTGRLDGSATAFETYSPIRVTDGETVTIKGKSARSLPTLITISAPAATVYDKSNTLVPVIGYDTQSASDVCTQGGSTTYPTLDRGVVVGRNFELENFSGGQVIPCDRGGVIVPAAGSDAYQAGIACRGLSSHFPELPAGQPVGKSMSINTDDATLMICSRPLKKVAQGPSTWIYFDGASRVVSSDNGWIQLESTDKNFCNGRVRLQPKQAVTYGDLLDPSFTLEVQGSWCSNVKVGLVKNGDRLQATTKTLSFPLIKKAYDQNTWAGYGDVFTIKSSALNSFSNGTGLSQISLVLFTDRRDDTQKQAYEKLTIDLPVNEDN